MPALMTKKNIAALVIAIIIVVIAFAEMAGWPFLAQPMQSKISDLLKRQVILGENTHQDKTIQQASTVEPFSVRFLGGITLETQKLVISAPGWSNKPYFVNADQVALKLRYIDIWRAYKGKPIRIKSLQAQNLQAYIERLDDGRASWQFTQPPQKQTQSVRIPTFDYLSLAKAFVQINDVPTQSNIKANVSFSNVKDRKSTRLNSSHSTLSRMPSSA